MKRVPEGIHVVMNFDVRFVPLDMSLHAARSSRKNGAPRLLVTSPARATYDCSDCSVVGGCALWSLVAAETGVVSTDNARKTHHISLAFFHTATVLGALRSGRTVPAMERQRELYSTLSSVLCAGNELQQLALKLLIPRWRTKRLTACYSTLQPSFTLLYLTLLYLIVPYSSLLVLPFFSYRQAGRQLSAQCQSSFRECSQIHYGN